MDWLVVLYQFIVVFVVFEFTSHIMLAVVVVGVKVSLA